MRFFFSFLSTLRLSCRVFSPSRFFCSLPAPHPSIIRKGKLDGFGDEFGEANARRADPHRCVPRPFPPPCIACAFEPPLRTAHPHACAFACTPVCTCGRTVAVSCRHARARVEGPLTCGRANSQPGRGAARPGSPAWEPRQRSGSAPRPRPRLGRRPQFGAPSFRF